MNITKAIFNITKFLRTKTDTKDQKQKWHIYSELKYIFYKN